MHVLNSFVLAWPVLLLCYTVSKCELTARIKRGRHQLFAVILLAYYVY